MEMSKPPSRYARNMLKRLNADPGLPKLPPDIQRKLLEDLSSPKMRALVKGVEDAKLLYAEVLAREKKAGSPIPMLHPWRCQGCALSGTMSVGSRDKQSLTLQRISLIHHSESPTCHEQNGTRRIMLGSPTLKDWSPTRVN
jgi:hypothetical protein